MKFYVSIFVETLPRKFKFVSNLTTITGTLPEDICIIMIMLFVFMALQPIVVVFSQPGSGL
jgi:hypothetical protein